MKIKDGFVLKKVSDEYLVVPVGTQSLDFKSVVKLNETGAFLWNNLLEETTEDDLLNKVLEEYSINPEAAMADIVNFTSKLYDAGIIE